MSRRTDLNAVDALIGANKHVKGSRAVRLSTQNMSKPVIPSVQCDKHRAVEIIVGFTIAPMNELQIKRWKRDGVLICAHGKKVDLRIVELVDVTQQTSSKRRKVIQKTTDQKYGETYSEAFFECDCSSLDPRPFWPPDDYDIKEAWE